MNDLPVPISTDGLPIDVPLLRKAVEWAEAEAAKPERESEWYQGDFVMSGAFLGRSCKTAYCVAGHVVAQADGPLDPDVYLGFAVADRARDLLGITFDESVYLFSMYNDVEHIREAAERIAARAGERL